MKDQEQNCPPSGGRERRGTAKKKNPSGCQRDRGNTEEGRDLKTKEGACPWEGGAESCVKARHGPGKKAADKQ